ncbi:hypothetical protein DSM104329_01730 [Capillimicrobium parvum]|uniref:PD-(D/E)XK endonuclease-like domain-containing protein n=1 Tax=Capillimicrobium parvum TaxID=2884022 RepID=A0A9E6XVT0_9ACTN|nr:hypothetical protein DSM104329_01730 [Capillimicrobium parvum]
MHATLAALVEPGPPFDERSGSLTRTFESALTDLAGPRPVRRSRVAAARLTNVASRAVSLVVEAGEPVELRCEQLLESHAGRIKGILDLTIRSAVLHAVVDYKTGTVLDDEGALATHLQDQLALYGVLEEARTGHWPDRAVILRFGGAPVEWKVDRTRCEEVVQEALELRARYLDHLGSRPPASPAPSVYRHCSFAPRCEAFWDAFTDEWAAPLAVRGRVVWSERSAAGGLTVKLEEVEGVCEGHAAVQGLAEPEGREIKPGDTLALVGLWIDRDQNLNGGASTRIWVSAS